MQRQFQGEILKVYVKNEKLYLDGYLMKILFGSRILSGEEDEYYEVNQETLESFEGMEIAYYYLPKNAKIHGEKQLVQQETKKEETRDAWMQHEDFLQQRLIEHMKRTDSEFYREMHEESPKRSGRR